MCFNNSKNADPGAARNEEIERQLREDKKRMAVEVKMLLLGAGESGKSTVLKQMRLIHHGGFQKAEREQFRVVIFNNLTNAFQVILTAMTDHDVRFENDGNIKHAELIMKEPEVGMGDPYPRECFVAFTSLWADRGVQEAIQRGNEYALHDNLNYFFNDIERLFARDYLPTDQDILHARLRTTGVSETIFDLGRLKYRMFDVGGQRSERKKWIHVFDNVQVVLFLASISGYDHVLLEDQSGVSNYLYCVKKLTSTLFVRNQMNEALMLFESVANSKWFEKSSLILFLNKIDLFREKLESRTSPIRNHFPDYNGGETDVKAAQEFFADKFRALIRSRKEVYVHYTNATDTDLLKKTMTSVQDMIIQRNLNQLMA